MVVINEGIPVHDTAAVWAHACKAGNRTRIVGPNCPGVISPGQSLAGITPADITGTSPASPHRRRHHGPRQHAAVGHTGIVLAR